MPRYESPYDPSTSPQNLEHVIYDKKGHVAYVTINRPDVKNALHSYAYAELRSCWRDIGLDPNIYVGIVTGAGDAFCAGRDVKFLASHQAQGKRTPHEDPNNPLFHWGGGGQPSDANLEKPLIAAINGLAVGVGLTLALQCQLRVMAEDAWIGDTHTKVGRLGSAHNLYEMLPRTTAAMLDCVAIPQPGDPYIIPKPDESYASLAKKPPGKLKVGIVLDELVGIPVDREVAQAVEAAGKTLAGMGHVVERAKVDMGGADVLIATTDLFFFGFD